MADIRVSPSTWICTHTEWSPPPPDCARAGEHFHADCKTGSCDRFNTGARIWGASPAMVIEKMQRHVTEAHEDEPGQHALFKIGGL